MQHLMLTRIYILVSSSFSGDSIVASTQSNSVRMHNTKLGMMKLAALSGVSMSWITAVSQDKACNEAGNDHATW